VSEETYYTVDELTETLKSKWSLQFTAHQNGEKPDRKFCPIEARFLIHHLNNPDVYQLFKKFAYQVKNGSFERYGCNAICERIRWHIDVELNTEESFKMPSEYVSLYARMMMLSDPNLRDFFHTRRLRIDSILEDLWLKELSKRVNDNAARDAA